LSHLAIRRETVVSWQKDEFRLRLALPCSVQPRQKGRHGGSPTARALNHTLAGIAHCKPEQLMADN
jgi:hypothetical protein